METKMRAVFLNLTLTIVVFLPGGSDSWCVGIGKNPTFVTTPTVSQTGLTTVYLSWANIVQDLECADNFLVSYWIRGNPHEYKLTEFIDPKSSGVTIEDLRPNIPYVFEVIAREDKGLLGIDYNRSPKISYTISRRNRKPVIKTPVIKKVPPSSGDVTDVSANDVTNDDDVSDDEDDEPTLTEIAERIQEEQETRKSQGSKLVVIVGCVVGALILILVLVGITYQLIKMQQRRKRTLTSGTEDRSTRYDRMKENVAIVECEDDMNSSEMYNREFPTYPLPSSSSGGALPSDEPTAPTSTSSS